MTTPAQTPDLSSGIVGSQPPPAAPAASDSSNLASGIVGDQSDDPSKTGFMVNDVGNHVIVPKDGESFGDTVKRAIQYHKSLPPEEQDKAMQREVATIPKKTAQAVAGAAAAGVAGPAALAAPLELHAAMTAGIAELTPALTKGVVAVGEWAAAHPLAAKTILETLKLAVAGTIAGKIAGIGKKVINANPD